MFSWYLSFLGILFRWKKNRALITPAFTVGKIKNIYPSIVEVAKQLVQYLKDHPEELHVSSLFTFYIVLYTFSVIKHQQILGRCCTGFVSNLTIYVSAPSFKVNITYEFSCHHSRLTHNKPF